ncbi:MAG TPA: M23 family metallopeptidase [Mycobacteriales bacterium]|jgi:murein DD-endopeptidase MepM/ murein hydrolase activator NlpD|nr:M23 family metallopeptidase [Mycobacteriales bacterium]
MRVGRVRRLAAVALLGALLPLTPARADDPHAQRRAVQARLATTKDDLDEASAVVREAAAALSATAAALPGARTRLAEAEGRLSAAQAAAGASARAAEAARRDLAAATASYAAAETALGAARERAGDVARMLYMTGSAGLAAALLDARTPADLAARAAYTHAILADGDARVRAAGDARVALANAASLLAARRAAVEARDAEARAALARVTTLAEAARAAAAEVERHVAARRAALAVAARERAADLARYRALEAESARLAALIRRLAARRPSTVRVSVSGLLWPTPGPVTSGFGWRIHPIYGYRRFHAGVDIGAPTGQPIVAALGGVVVTAGPLGTYGNLVVVDHGNGFATAYGHQSRVLVRVGQRVARGERIGLVGATGAATGPHLHFETRVDGDPVDPLRYF